MAVKKILIIDESSLFREYLSNKLMAKGFNVVQGTNGLDGSIKMRRELPDLLITDYYLTRKSSREVLQEKKGNPNTAGTPVIMVSSKIDKEKLVEIAPYGVKKFFTKPLKIDSLLKAVADLLNVTIEMDTTPCIIETHYNEEILFVEVALGLNIDKIELLQYKITELLQLYHAFTPRVLIMLSNLALSEADEGKLTALISTVLEYSRVHPRHLRILTNDGYAREFVDSHREFADIGVTNSLEIAMDELIGVRDALDKAPGEKLLRSTKPASAGEEAIEMRFADEGELAIAAGLDKMGGHYHIAVVDDDVVIQELVKTAFSETGWVISGFANGKQFVDSLPGDSYDLVFLDLMMPEMDGFEVLEYLKKNSISLPIIVFSALSRKETVVKAVNFGVNSYMIKPIKPERILMKAAEILKADF